MAGEQCPGSAQDFASDAGRGEPPSTSSTAADRPDEADIDGTALITPYSFFVTFAGAIFELLPYLWASRWTFVPRAVLSVSLLFVFPCAWTLVFVDTLYLGTTVNILSKPLRLLRSSTWSSDEVLSFSLTSPAGRVALALCLMRGEGWRSLLLCTAFNIAVTMTCMMANYLIYHRTLLKNIEVPWYEEALTFSLPINVIQQVFVNLVTTLLLRRLSIAFVPSTQVLVIGFLSIYVERILVQRFIYLYHHLVESDTSSGQRVFFLTGSSSADTGHWVLSVEGIPIHIFKEGGAVTAELVRPDPSRDSRVWRIIPSLRQSLYIPFVRYGIIGLASAEETAESLEEWRGFVEDSMGKYSASNRSCQEYCIFMAYRLVKDANFNMSDAKSLTCIIPLLLPFVLAEVPPLWRKVAEWVVADWNS